METQSNIQQPLKEKLMSYRNLYAVKETTTNKSQFEKNNRAEYVIRFIQSICETMDEQYSLIGKQVVKFKKSTKYTTIEIRITTPHIKTCAQIGRSVETDRRAIGMENTAAHPEPIDITGHTIPLVQDPSDPIYFQGRRVVCDELNGGCIGTHRVAHKKPCCASTDKETCSSEKVASNFIGSH
jgi:hypothetical protein